MTNKITNLYNEMTFYPALLKDMLNAEKEVIIYSPFVSKYRAAFFNKILLKLKRNNIHMFIFTRPIEEHAEYMREEIRSVIHSYEGLGIHVTYIKGSIHEKVAIIDRRILWEGSLNILSQKSSKELMRRLNDENLASQILAKLDLNQKLIEGYKLQGQSHDLKLDFGQRVRILLIEPIAQIIKWSLTTTFQVMMVVLKGIVAVFSIVELIVG